MSNDELQKAIDDITSGDAAAAAAATDDSSATAGTASVTLPDDLAGGSSDTNLNFSETPDAMAGASADIFAAPPVPDTSSAMPADSGFDNPAAGAAPAAPEAPSVPESPLGVDPLAGFDPDSVTLNTAEPAAVATVPAEPVKTSEVPAEPAMPTTDSLDAQPTEVPNTEPVDITDTALPEAAPVNAVAGDVVSEARKELYPLLDKVSSMSDEEKCDVCLEVGGDALPEALKYAKSITDETARAEKLLQIIEKAK